MKQIAFSLCSYSGAKRCLWRAGCEGRFETKFNGLLVAHVHFSNVPGSGTLANRPTSGLEAAFYTVSLVASFVYNLVSFADSATFLLWPFGLTQYTVSRRVSESRTVCALRTWLLAKGKLALSNLSGERQPRQL